MAIDLSPRQNGPEWPNHMLKRVCAGFFCKQGSEFEMSMAVSDGSCERATFEWMDLGGGGGGGNLLCLCHLYTAMIHATYHTGE